VSRYKREWRLFPQESVVVQWMSLALDGHPVTKTLHQLPLVALRKHVGLSVSRPSGCDWKRRPGRPRSLDRSSSAGLEHLTSGTLESCRTMWSWRWSVATTLTVAGYMITIMNYSSCNVLSLHSSSFTAVSSPVWEGRGGMVNGVGESGANWLTQVQLEGQTSVCTYLLTSLSTNDKRSTWYKARKDTQLVCTEHVM